MVLTVYALRTIQVPLYALRDTIWSQQVFIYCRLICSLFQYILVTFNTSFGFRRPVSLTESLRYLSMYDNRCLRYFKGHKER